MCKIKNIRLNESSDFTEYNFAVMCHEHGDKWLKTLF